jgi:hypothetical protein
MTDVRSKHLFGVGDLVRVEPARSHDPKTGGTLAIVVGYNDGRYVNSRGVEAQGVNLRYKQKRLRADGPYDFGVAESALTLVKRAPRPKKEPHRGVVTAQDRTYAKILIAAVKKADEEKLAQLLAGMHDRAVACAVVEAEREREWAEQVSERNET